jgi:sugar/nucleoside kinase (ribokinase family)
MKLADARAKTFDVICVGSATVRLTRKGNLQLGPGAVGAELRLAHMGASVGLASAFQDDAVGRRTRDALADAGVDSSAVSALPPSSGVFLVEGREDDRDVVESREREDVFIGVPEGWSSRVVLVSGVSPLVSHGAALVKVARAARRWGALVVVDLNARARTWNGRDARAIRSVLREADVVRATMDDLVVLRVDVATLREMAKPTAVLVLGETRSDARASGPFGEIAPPPNVAPAKESASALVARLCFELARTTSDRVESSAALWERALHH